MRGLRKIYSRKIYVKYGPREQVAYEKRGEETLGNWVAEKETYGADRLWVLVRNIPIVLDDGESESSSPSGSPGGATP